MQARRLSAAALVGAVILAPQMLRAQDGAANRWTGFYAGGDIGGAAASERAAPCHVGCERPGYDGHAGYQSPLGGSGLVGGVETDVGRPGR